MRQSGFVKMRLGLIVELLRILRQKFMLELYVGGDWIGFSSKSASMTDSHLLELPSINQLGLDCALQVRRCTEYTPRNTVNISRDDETAGYNSALPAIRLAGGYEKGRKGLASHEIIEFTLVNFCSH